MKTGQKIGYARVSTEDQNLDGQIKVLLEAGVPKENIFQEHASGANMDRKVLSNALNCVHQGDTLVIVKLDRLGRSLKGLIEVMDLLDERGADFEIVKDGIDTSTIGGRMVFQIMGAIAEFERNIISERTKMGLAAKRAKGWRSGPKHHILDYPKRLERFCDLLAEGKISLFRDGPELLTVQQVIDEMHAADPKAPKIKSQQTYRTWRRKGFPGFEEDEPPLELDK